MDTGEGSWGLQWVPVRCLEQPEQLRVGWSHVEEGWEGRAWRGGARGSGTPGPGPVLGAGTALAQLCHQGGKSTGHRRGKNGWEPGQNKLRPHSEEVTPPERALSWGQSAPSWGKWQCLQTSWVIKTWRVGFPGGPGLRNLPANAGHTGSIPDPGRFYMRWSN